MKSKGWCALLVFFLVFFMSAGIATSLTPLLSTVKVTWHGHACFTVACWSKVRVVIDSYTPDRTVVAVYKTPSLEGEVVLVTHEHLDHNNSAAVAGNPQVFRGVGPKQAVGINFKGIASFHDDKAGQERGPNTIFRWECGGITFAHLGDLGQKQLTPEQVKQLSGVEVLFIPVGGTYTIGPKEAGEIVEQIKPKIVVPMHYKPQGAPADNPLVGVEQFLKEKRGIKYLGSNTFEVHKTRLPQEREIWVLEEKELLK